MNIRIYKFKGIGSNIYGGFLLTNKGLIFKFIVSKTTLQPVTKILRHLHETQFIKTTPNISVVDFNLVFHRVF